MPHLVYCRPLPNNPIDRQIQTIRDNLPESERDDLDVLVDDQEGLLDVPLFERAVGRLIPDRVPQGGRLILATGSAVWNGPDSVSTLLNALEAKGATLVMIAERQVVAPHSMEAAAWRAMAGIHAAFGRGNKERGERIKQGLKKNARAVKGQRGIPATGGAGAPTGPAPSLSPMPTSSP